MTIFNKLRVLEANFSAPDSTEFQAKKDSRLGLFKEIMNANDRRVMVAHRPFEIKEDDQSIYFRFHTAKGTLVNQSSEISFSDFDAEINELGRTAVRLNNFVKGLKLYEPSLDFSDSRNSGYLILL